MKHRSFKTILAVLFGVCMMATSCEDMLTPELTRFSDQFAKDSVYSAFGILKSVQRVGERLILLDAARSDLSTTGTYTTDSIKQIANFENPEDGSSTLLNAADFYHIINSCNFYLTRVDTVLNKNGVPEMLREYAQVQSIRAWTYLQLVRFYGSVPFVVEPIEDTDQAAELEKNAPRATKENLIDLLLENGIERAYEIQHHLHLPNYSTVGSVSTRNQFIPIQLVIADAYLMKSEYEKAAEFYYDYFYYEKSDDYNESYACETGQTRNADGTRGSYYPDADSWIRLMRNVGNDLTTVIAGATNSTLGITLTGVAEIFGFETSSSTSGTSVSPNEQYQQILPSASYISLNEAQKFSVYRLDGQTEVKEYIEGYGDGRLYGTAPYVVYERNGERNRVIQKFCPGSGAYPTNLMGARGFSVNYYLPVYRQAQVYLRYAEAINRMGFPQIAFAILKDGLFAENFPTLSTHDVDLNRYAINPLDRADTLGVIVTRRDANGDVLTDTAGVVLTDTVFWTDDDHYRELPIERNVAYFSSSPLSNTGGIYYLTVDEMLRASNYKFLDFWTDNTWQRTNAITRNYGGIHSRGCGITGGTLDTIFTYAKMVAKKVAANRALKAGSMSVEDQLNLEAQLHHGDTLMVDLMTQDEIIDAVEDLIVDESALETAFEGHRFTDLLRIADHKTKAGSNGTNWFAWKMARRNVDVNEPVANYDAALYAKMQDPTYWYFELPKKK